MRKLSQILMAFAFVAASGLGVLMPMTASAQSTNDCMVSGDYGGFIINDARTTVTGRFSISGSATCTPVQVSIAVWMFNEGDRLQDQVFFGGNTGTFGYRAPQTNQAFATHDITTNLPTSDEYCKLQIDLVRGGQRANPDHPFPNGPFYDERRMNAIIIDNPACQEVVEVPGPVREVEVPGPVREVEVEVPGPVREVVKEVPVDRIVEVQSPAPQPAKELPRTGLSSAFALPAFASITAGAGHYINSRRK